MRARNVKIVITVSLIIGAIALLVVSTTTKSGYTTHYYKTTSEFLRNASDYVNASVRVNGKVVPGSVRRAPLSAEGESVLEFVLGDSVSTVPVHYAGAAVPDAFKEGADVVVEGVYTADGVLNAQQLLVKCPSKYEAMSSQM